MALPLQKRDFDLFLSHAHKDTAFVAEIDRWMTQKAGLSVWYDERELAGGALLATDLQAAIKRCRGVLLVATDNSVRQGWVRNEYNAAMDEGAIERSFRVVALRVANADVSELLLQGTTWISVPEPRLDADTALKVVKALYPGEKRPNPATARDVFVSCSWQKEDGKSARAVCRALAAQGFRLIGDAQDQKRFGAEREDRIIASCGAFVSIVPFRGVDRASPTEKPYKYFLQEIDMAARLGIPSIVISDPRVRRVDGANGDWLPMETAAEQCPPEVALALERLWEQWEPPPAPQYIFCAMDLEAEAARSGSAIRHLIERITGMQSVVGNEIHEEPLQPAIIKKICGASLVLADITDDNLNTCIEAGMALAAGRRVELLARGKPRRPPFMLRALQLVTYGDEVEQIGVLHNMVRPYRRRVINAEL